MDSTPVHFDPAEAAALYVAGALIPEEAAWFETCIRRGDSEFVAALDALRAAQEALLTSVEPVAASDSVRKRVMDFAIETPNTTTAPQSEAYIQRDEARLWKQLPLVGVQYRMMFVDRQKNLQTILLKIAPGTELPFHAHDEAEECYVIDGELETLGTVLKAGDYFRFPPQTTHKPSRSPKGCSLLVTGSIDEALAAGWV